MAGKYYLHRISHESNASYSLLDKGYLTLGWSLFKEKVILEAARDGDEQRFNSIAKEYSEDHNRSRWCMWYFGKMDIGDIVVVPLYGGKFSVCEVTDIAKPISDLEGVEDSFIGKWDSHQLKVLEGNLIDCTDNRIIDLGFYIKVKTLVSEVQRKKADGRLISRMKMRQTNGEISEIGQYVDSVIQTKGEPASFYTRTMETLSENMRKSIVEKLNDTRFEKLVKWYLEQCGASKVYIPPKNSPDKVDGADADVIAEFENLKYIVYVQAKWHDGKTKDWAVQQVAKYKDQNAEDDSEYTYATWVVSSGEDFSEEAYALAMEKKVRLINGYEFARMILNIGVDNIDDAMDY